MGNTGTSTNTHLHFQIKEVKGDSGQDSTTVLKPDRYKDKESGMTMKGALDPAMLYNGFTLGL